MKTYGSNYRRNVIWIGMHMVCTCVHVEFNAKEVLNVTSQLCQYSLTENLLSFFCDNVNITISLRLALFVGRRFVCTYIIFSMYILYCFHFNFQYVTLVLCNIQIYCTVLPIVNFMTSGGRPAVN